MTDTNKLKELAERATPGRNFDRLPSAGGGLKYTCTGDDDSLVLRVDHKNGEFGFIGPKGEEDEAFFLACTPQAVLELIAEVERLRGTLLMVQNAMTGTLRNAHGIESLTTEAIAEIDAALEGGGR